MIMQKLKSTIPLPYVLKTTNTNGIPFLETRTTKDKRSYKSSTEKGRAGNQDSNIIKIFSPLGL